jgi:hypothetical protein
MNRYDARVWLGGAGMRRREFITLVGGAISAWPFSAGAQQAAMPVIGYLGTGTSSTDRGRCCNGDFSDGKEEPTK